MSAVNINQDNLQKDVADSERDPAGRLGGLARRRFIAEEIAARHSP